MAAPPSASYQLPPEWADYLKARGVPPDVAAERGYQVVLSGKPLDGDFAASWGFNQKYSGLLIPLHGILNKSAVQLRLAHPEDFAEGSGKAPRFRQPAKQPNVLITHPRTRAALTQPGEIIFVAEGATRVDVLAAYSIPAVGILGINNWKGGKPPVAIADFDALGIKGNRFVIVPDGDVRVNKNVNRATSRLATFLRGRGADAVHILAVPGDKGLDDWLAAEHFPDKDAVLHAILAHVVSETPKVQVSVPDAGAAFAVDNAGAWACTPVADARRVLEYQPEKLCVVRGTNGGEWRLLVEQKGGRWSASRDIAALSEMHIESALRWQRQVSTAVMAGKLDEDHAKNCTRWAIQSAKPQGVKDLLGMVGATVRYLETLDMWSGEVVSCDEDDIDADRLCIGAPNGVVCLKSGKLLPAKEARKRFVTRHIPDDFDSEAVHPYADALVAHLTAEDKRYLLSALGFALRGNPARRLYGLAGSKGGAKSTLLNAIVAALGDVKRTGYGMRLDVEALLLTRWTGGKSAHQGQLIGLQDARIAVTEEPPANQRFNTALLKDLSGGLVQQMREVGEKAGPARPATATMFIAMNHGQEDALDTSDEALADRARLLRYPKLTAAEVDPERISDVTTIRKVRQAVVALLVKWAAETPKRPEAPLSVQAFTEQRRQESIGAVGQYIQANVKVTSRRTDYMSVKQLMDELGEAIGKTNDRIEGMTQREVLALMRELVPDLPRATNKRGDGRIYRGVTLDDPDANLKAAPCQRCGQERAVHELDVSTMECLDAAQCGDDDTPSAPPAGGGGGEPQGFEAPSFKDELARRIEAGQEEIKQTVALTHRPGGESSDDDLQHLLVQVGNLLMLQEALTTAPAPPVTPAALVALRSASVEDLVDTFVTAAAPAPPVAAEEWARILRDLRLYVEDEMQKQWKQAEETGWLARRLAQLGQLVLPGFTKMVK